MPPRRYLYILTALALGAQPDCHAATADDEHIRKIVQTMLQDKDRKIEQLEARIRQLEQERPPTVAALQPAAPAAVPEKAAANAKPEPTVDSKLKALDKKVAELKEAAEANGLVMSGFFDINAKTGNSTDQTFSVGSVELDLDYVHDDHFGASSALVLCGNSSNADYGAPGAVFCGNSGPGALSGGSTTAGIAVALVDYHLFNDRIPPRGRIFNNKGLHIQAGRFDLPFGSDYQYFANKDRVTVTAPLTTSRMQLGGYNADGLRSYGNFDWFNYSVFWTDALYANDGHTIGGRLGLSLGQNAYKIHSSNPEGIEFGISHLSELDGENRIRNTVYGADLAIGYGVWRLQNEFMLLNAHQQVFLDQDGDGNPIIVVGPNNSPFGKGHQLGYHSTFTVDLASLAKMPIIAFARYSRWQPSQNLGLDFDGSTVAINDISMLSLGFNYKFSDHLQVKFEYDDSLGTETAERYFDRKLGIAQIVMSF
ncbi:hypothetical protein [Methylomonas koyamae]|uniref:hypothetical protein n=1 Tax=Methylomonas koyamae TaxID=702114 RepID=UPI0011280FDF|nr:hypothetical protein [Methylomonas koyamae]